jgi:hypothetical protein
MLLKVVYYPICDWLYSRDLCAKLYENDLHLFITRFFDFLSPTLLCARLQFCISPTIVPDSNQRYIRDLLKDRPPYREARPSDRREKLRFVVFADAHIDYAYAEVSIF